MEKRSVLWVSRTKEQPRVIVKSLDLSKLRILPLAARRSLTRADEILIDPDAMPPPCPDRVSPMVEGAAAAIRARGIAARP